MSGLVALVVASIEGRLPLLRADYGYCVVGCGIRSRRRCLSVGEVDSYGYGCGFQGFGDPGV